MVFPPRIWNKIKSLKELKQKNQISILNNETIVSEQQAVKQLGDNIKKKSSH